MRDKKAHATYMQRWREKNPDANKKTLKKWYAKYKEIDRARIFKILGSVCKGCGFTDKRALQVDHINNDGRSDRKYLHKGNSSLGAIRTRLRLIQKDPSRFQILCANCNTIKEAIRREPSRGKFGVMMTKLDS